SRSTHATALTGRQRKAKCESDAELCGAAKAASINRKAGSIAQNQDGLSMAWRLQWLCIPNRPANSRPFRKEGENNETFSANGHEQSCDRRHARRLRQPTTDCRPVPP